MNRFFIFSLMLIASSLAGFELISPQNQLELLIDPNEHQTVKTVAEHFSEDIAAVSGKKVSIIQDLSATGKTLLIAGTYANNRFIQQLSAEGKLDLKPIKNRWESWTEQTVKNPFPGIKEAFVIVATDRRAVAYALFNISEKMGVSPWYWWADVPIETIKSFSLSDDQWVSTEPAVRYRGIFLNDEDWGLQPWAAAGLDQDIMDIGPNTYAKIFELLLRLKANMIWPAMHNCTRAFYSIEGNREVADQYGIIISTSHCEPMLRNNVGEWHSKGKGSWNYVVNSRNIRKYWDQRLAETAFTENIYTIGMRGIHDGDMPGGGSLTSKTKRLEKVIRDQRKLLSNYYDNPQEIPQIFCPYKEVLGIYQNNLSLPEDVTIVWADDNHGHIRQLSNPTEQQRKGASGVYYHLSYWGAPQDYLWLSSTSPGLIWFEMNKALTTGANRFWVFNVGDIKPAEKELTFALDYAWRGNDIQADDIPGWIEGQMNRFFGEEYSSDLTRIMLEYYRLASGGKPEHLNKIQFSADDKINEAKQRILDYQTIKNEVKEISKGIPKNYRASFFQLIEYPIVSAAAMNEKFYYSTFDNQKRDAAFEEIQRLTQYYNEELSDGKWNKMMSWNPRNRPVFKKEQTSSRSQQKQLLKINANQFFKKVDSKDYNWLEIPSLGESGNALTLTPTQNWKTIDQKNKLELYFSLPNPQKKNMVLEVRTLPSHRIFDPLRMRYSVSINGEKEFFTDAYTPSSAGHYGDGEWSQNVLKGFCSRSFKLPQSTENEIEIIIRTYDPGIVFDQLVIIEKE